MAEPPVRDQVRFLREEEVNGRMTEVIESMTSATCRCVFLSTRKPAT